MKRAWCAWVFVGAAVFGGLGCSSDEAGPVAPSCTVGVSRCLTDTVGAVCPESGVGELAFACDPGQACEAGACVGGSCAAGEKQCVTSALSRVCTSDSAWLAFACAAHSSCERGECLPDADAPDADTPDADPTDADPTDEDPTDEGDCSCAADELCRDGACIAVSAACTAGSGVCAGADTLFRCQSDGQGYTPTSCPESAPCSDGACRGPVCNAGETKCEEIGSTMSTPFDHVLSCVDGTKWEITRCGARQLCAYDLDRETRDHDLAILNDPSSHEPIVIPPGVGASCRDINCSYERKESALPYAFSCGDPMDLTVDPLHTYSWCTSAPPIVSTEWVTYDCLPDTFCIDRIYGCAGTCAAGDTRCNGGKLETCGADGKFGAATACDDGFICGYLGRQNAGVARCLDPICSSWHSYGPYEDPPLQYGQCVSQSQIRPCLADGSLGPPQPCFEGTCRLPGAVGAGELAGGCVTDCVDGDQRCLGDPPSALPFTQTCVGGKWLTTACPDNLACVFTLGGVACGECAPGETRCSDDGLGMQTCNAAALWDPVTPCAVGTCDPGGSACATECVPNTVACESTHYGTICDADGSPSHEACSGDKLCRFSASGSALGPKYLGCVECVGPDAGGNLEFGLADSRCPDTTHLTTCGSNDKWQAPVACPSGTVCRAVARDDGSTLAGCVANP